MGVKGRVWDCFIAFYTKEKPVVMCGVQGAIENFPNRNWIAPRFSVVTSVILFVYC